MTEAKARAVLKANGPFEPTTINRRDVGPNDVLIDIAFAGICHSDIHTAKQEWGDITFPITPGHEIAGTVAQVGADVTKFKIGDRVGVGCMVDSCGTCENCKADQEQFCIKGNVPTYNGVDKFGDGTPTQGGYSSHIVVTEKFVLSIPEGIELDVAAPLLCAGITTYSPLHHWGAGPGKKVAVIGLGGLGHMAVKIAHAMDADVTVFSRSENKREDSAKLGADHYVNTGKDGALEELASSFDLIINTVSSADMDFNALFQTLKVDGALVNVGAPPKPIAVNAFSLIGGRRSFAGSLIGGIKETQEMLDFCAQHNLGAEIEVINANQIDEAYDRVANSDVRYRFVIDNATL